MTGVQMQARALFGNTGLAQDILMYLQSPDGGQSAVYALGGLKNGMERCGDYMGEVCMAFDDVIETAGELNLALTAESAANERKKARTAVDQETQTFDIEVQKYFLEEHKKQLEKGEQSLKKAQRDFNKTSKHSELKVLGFKTLSDIQGFFSGTLGAAVNIVKESPKIALTGDLEDASKVLSEAIDVLFMIKNGFNKIKHTFEFLAKYIDILVNGNTVARLTYAMEAAKDRTSPGDMLCYQIQARTIVDRVLQMRGHFMFIYDMSKLYSEISQSYIMPCIHQMAILKVSKLNTADRQEKEKACIDEFTTKCSEEIIKRAQKEMETFQQEMTARCEEIREDSRLQGLDRLNEVPEGIESEAVVTGRGAVLG
ncbi:hypothetical protein CBS470a_008106 [Colletotrichum nupharicola]|nr:hypothetical protein CBS470a_008106 [Colletotrichum nupharicola]